MPGFTVKSASLKKEVEGRHGPMKVIALTLEDESGEQKAAEWFTKATTPVPEPGERLEGELQQGQYGLNFKKAAATGGGGGGGFRPRDPAERRSIAMQHAQKCAVTVLQVAAEHGDYTPPNAADVVGQVKTVAAVLFRQVLDAEDGQLTETPTPTPLPDWAQPLTDKDQKKRLIDALWALVGDKDTAKGMAKEWAGLFGGGIPTAVFDAVIALAVKVAPLGPPPREDMSDIPWDPEYRDPMEQAAEQDALALTGAEDGQEGAS